VTRVGGIVYARSVFHHSMNYASAIIHGTATVLADPRDKLAGLRALTEHLAPGSWDAARLPTRKELAKTTVLALPLHEASVKMRSGPPSDDEEDLNATTTWAGVLPLRQAWCDPEPCPLLPPGVPIPERVTSRHALP
jgi:hypothetical protein